MLDVQEGMEWMIKLWKEWQKVQKELRQEQEEEDKELSWGIGGLEIWQEKQVGRRRKVVTRARVCVFVFCFILAGYAFAILF